MAVAERDESADVIAISIVRQAALKGVTRRVRECSHVTLEELGQWIGVEPGTVSRWESGRRTPRTDAAKRYTRAIELLVATLDEDCDPSVYELRASLHAARQTGDGS